MTKAAFVELVLKCGSWQEAQQIADRLLEKQLVTCVEFLEIKSKYHWQKSVEEANEIKLVMESIAGNFKLVETEVAKIRSHDTFILQQVPLVNLSKKARPRLNQETQAKD